MIGRTIDKSFVSGFRWVTVIGAALAAASAVTALFWIGAMPKKSPEQAKSGAIY